MLDPIRTDRGVPWIGMPARRSSSPTRVVELSEADLPCPWCGAATSEADDRCPHCLHRFG